MTTPEPLSAASVDDELVNQLARQKLRAPLPVFGVAAAIAGMAWDAVPAWASLGWLAGVVVVLMLRHRMLTAISMPGALSVRDGLRQAVFLSAANGVMFALSLGFAPFLEPYERIVQTLLLLGLCTGAVATTTGYAPVFLSFMGPPVAALCIAWAVHSLQGGWIEAVVAVLSAAFGALLFGMARDTHRLFRESFEMRRQQESTNIQLRDALRLAEAANRAKTRFLASASHDLRQPMHTLSLFAEALWLRPLDAVTREIGAHMREALLALGTQLDALLDISKLDAQVVEVVNAPVDLNAMMRKLHHQYVAEAERRGLHWRIEGSSAVACSTDALLLERILRNLIDNAFKYTSSGGVTLALGSTADAALVRIVDTGCGIPPEEQERVFEEFYQIGNRERDRAQGLGLGLSIVKRLANLLSIRLTLASLPGRGTEVGLSLPAAEGSVAPRPAPMRPASIAGLHILVIEDEEAVRIGMRALLAELGCSATLVASTAEGLEAAAQQRPDIVIADFRLRDDDSGVIATQKLRERMPNLPALLLSGDTAPARLIEARAAGIPLLHKPATLELLLDAISKELKTGTHRDANEALAASR